MSSGEGRRTTSFTPPNCKLLLGTCRKKTTFHCEMLNWKLVSPKPYGFLSELFEGQRRRKTRRQLAWTHRRDTNYAYCTIFSATEESIFLVLEPD